MSFTNVQLKEEGNYSNENNDEDFSDDNDVVVDNDIKNEGLDNIIVNGEYNSDDNPQGDNSELYQQ